MHRLYDAYVGVSAKRDFTHPPRQVAVQRIQPLKAAAEHKYVWVKDVDYHRESSRQPVLKPVQRGHRLGVPGVRQPHDFFAAQR